MGRQRPDNRNIQIGSIFRHTCRDECGSSSSFYQVTGLRGRTLVQLRLIRDETYVDARCEGSPVWCRPLPGQFADGKAEFTVRALEPSEGRNWLQGRGEDNWLYFSEVREGEAYRLYGYDAVYARLALQKKEEGVRS